jgi:hypothetical protein
MKRLLPILALPLILTACTKVTKSNYEKLKVGMTYDEVEKILGKPAKCDEAMIAQVCTWGGEKRNITVSFIGKQVILYTGKGLK